MELDDPQPDYHYQKRYIVPAGTSRVRPVRPVEGVLGVSLTCSPYGRIADVNGMLV